MSTTNRALIMTKLKTILQNDLNINMKPEEIREDLSLYEDGIGLDSISIVNFIVLIESACNITFDQVDLNHELFSSLGYLTSVIEDKLNVNNEVELAPSSNADQSN